MHARKPGWSSILVTWFSGTSFITATRWARHASASSSLPPTGRGCPTTPSRTSAPGCTGSIQPARLPIPSPTPLRRWRRSRGERLSRLTAGLDEGAGDESISGGRRPPPGLGGDRGVAGQAQLGDAGSDPPDPLGGGHVGRDVDDPLPDARARRPDDPVGGRLQVQDLGPVRVTHLMLVEPIAAVEHRIVGASPRFTEGFHRLQHGGLAAAGGVSSTSQAEAITLAMVLSAM